MKPAEKTIALIILKGTDKREQHLNGYKDRKAHLSFSFNSCTEVIKEESS